MGVGDEDNFGEGEVCAEVDFDGAFDDMDIESTILIGGNIQLKVGWRGTVSLERKAESWMGTRDEKEASVMEWVQSELDSDGVMIMVGTEGWVEGITMGCIRQVAFRGLRGGSSRSVLAKRLEECKGAAKKSLL